MHLSCGGIYNNHITARKNFENWSIIGKDIDQSKVARFFTAHSVLSVVVVDSQWVVERPCQYEAP